MLEPKEIQLITLNGESKTFTISKFPAVAGREIVAKYPLSSMPKLGDYAVNEATMFKLMSYVAVTLPNSELLQLKTPALVDNHVPDWETLAKIEFEMMRYNTSFFDKGKVFTFLKDTVQQFLVSALPTWKTSLEQLSQAARQRSKN